MPLSEHEQRILRQIEQELAQDPNFADRAARLSRRRLVWLSIVVIGGLALTIAGLVISFWVAFVAFLAVLAAGVALEHELRVVGRDRFGTLSINAWLTGHRRDAR